MSETPVRRRKRNSSVANSISNIGNDSRIVESDKATSVNSNYKISPPLMDTDDIVVKAKFNNAIEEYKLSHFSRAYSLFSDLCNLVPNNYILLAFKGIALGKIVPIENNNLSDATSQIIDSISLAPNFCSNSSSLYEFVIWVISEFSSLYDSHFSWINSEYNSISRRLNIQEKLVSDLIQSSLKQSDTLHDVNMFRIKTSRFLETNLYDYTRAENLQNSVEQSVKETDRRIKEAEKARDDLFAKLLEANRLLKSLSETLESFLSSIQRLCENSSLATFLEFWNSIEPLIKKCNEVNSDDIFKTYRGSLFAVACYFSAKEKKIKQQRIERYWAAHPEKKNQLLSAQDACKVELDKLLSKAEDIEITIRNLNLEKASILPSQEQAKKCEKYITDMRNSLSHLGMFQFKEKHITKKKIEKAIMRRDSYYNRAVLEKKDRNQRIDPQLDSLRDQLNEIRPRINELQLTYQSIEQELTMDR